MPDSSLGYHEKNCPLHFFLIMTGSLLVLYVDFIPCIGGESPLPSSYYLSLDGAVLPGNSYKRGCREQAVESTPVTQRRRISSSRPDWVHSGKTLLQIVGGKSLRSVWAGLVPPEASVLSQQVASSPSVARSLSPLCPSVPHLFLLDIIPIG